MTIKENVINEFIINKSKFITYIYKVNSKDEVLKHLNLLKKNYKDATHICYAYIIDNEIKFNDDKEPSGTSGLPILEVLKKNNLNHLVCFVIRYFGGIKLGSGGLIRAYSNSCSQALKKTNIIPLEKLFKIKLSIPYNFKKLDSILNTTTIINKTFQKDITYILEVNQTILKKLDNLNQNYIILDENY